MATSSQPLRICASQLPVWSTMTMQDIVHCYVSCQAVLRGWAARLTRRAVECRRYLAEALSHETDCCVGNLVGDRADHCANSEWQGRSGGHGGRRGNNR